MRWVTLFLVALASAVILALASLAAVTAFVWPNLPSLEALTDYRPQIPMRVYSADGELLGEFGEERRNFVRVQDLPPILTRAILAAEDERFYEHPGIDIMGVMRAAATNMVLGGKRQGASTITMQVARNFFLTREKTLSRKLYEVLLSLKIEHSLSKDEILQLYTNQIYLGHRAYGFSAAAQTYFGKPLKDISAAEAAMLAGLPKAPSAYNPITNPKRATLRQQYVLRRMHETAALDDKAYAAALKEPLHLAAATAHKGLPNEGAFVAEMARRIAVEQFGEDSYKNGLRVITTIHKADQAAAYAALRRGVEDYDRRHGYRGAEAFVTLPAAGPDFEDQLDDLLGDHPDYDDLLSAVVLQASPQAVKVYRDGETFSISGEGLRFAQPMLGDKAPATKRLRPGAVVRLRLVDAKYEISQLPQLEGALVSIDPHTGAVRALIGGFDYELSKFNHGTQAMRQPGSSFKPFIYSAAFEKGYGPASIVDDAPLSFPAGVTGGQAWEPKNYDNKYDGPMTLREALARSKNLVSIRLLDAIHPDYAQDYIGRFGFDPANHPPYLTMALGAGAASPWQMAEAYAVFANGGYRVQPYIVQEITDSEGKVLAKVDPPVAGESAPRVIDARNAFLIDSMLQGVVQHGTARRALRLKRNDLAGKTGTTNDYVDAWFCGYTPDLVAIAWVGFDQPHNMGRGETGGSAALPIWIDYMRVALQGQPEASRSVPPGLLVIHPDRGDNTDYIYAENLPPAPPPVPETPAFTSPFEQTSPQSSTPPPAAPVRQQPAAPVEDATPILLMRPKP